MKYDLVEVKKSIKDGKIHNERLRTIDAQNLHEAAAFCSREFGITFDKPGFALRPASSKN